MAAPHGEIAVGIPVKPPVLRQPTSRVVQGILQDKPQTVQFVTAAALGGLPCAVYFALWGIYGDILCPLPIGQWLLVTGIVSGVVMAIQVANAPAKAKHKAAVDAAIAEARRRAPPGAPIEVTADDLPPPSTLMTCLDCIVGLISIFNLVWFIMGNVWVFNSSEATCGELASVTQTLLIVQYSLSGAICFLGCCFAGCAASADAADDALPGP